MNAPTNRPTPLSPTSSEQICTGFPSPADDYIEAPLDLHQYMVKRPAATFFVRVRGESMRTAEICDGDLLVVDRSLAPKDKKIVVAVVGDQLTVRRLGKASGALFLVPEDGRFPSVHLDQSETQLWGVVTHVVRTL